MTTAVQFEFDAATHTYRDADKVIRPSVSQVIKAEGLISFEGINPAILEVKRQLGTLVHTVTELYDNGENLNEYEIPNEVWPYFEGWVNFRNDCGFEPRFIEQQMLASVHGMWYGMRLDAEGPIDGENYIIEKKCGSSEHPAWGVQLAGYVMGKYARFIREGSTLISNPNIPKRSVVQLGPQFPRNYKTHDYKENADYTEWMNALSSTIWKINKGLYQFEHVDERMIAA